MLKKRRFEFNNHYTQSLWNKVLLLIFFFIGAIYTNAQTSLKANIIPLDQLFEGKVEVILERSDKEQNLIQAFFDFEDSIVIHNIPYGVYNINILHQGFTSYTAKNILVKEATVDLGTIFLYPLSVHLKEVIIQEKLLKKKWSGDTLIFNPKAYGFGNELSLEDILSHISEFSLKGNKIRFQNFAIDSLLLDGILLESEDHKRFSTDIHLDFVQDIRITKQAPNNLSDTLEQQPKYNLNITVKKEKRNKPQLNVKGALGIINKYEVDAGFIRLWPKVSLYLKMQSNNTNDIGQGSDLGEILESVEYKTKFNPDLNILQPIEINPLNPKVNETPSSTIFHNLKATCNIKWSKFLDHSLKLKLNMVSNQFLSSGQKFFTLNRVEQVFTQNGKIITIPILMENYWNLKLNKGHPLEIRMPVEILTSNFANSYWGGIDGGLSEAQLERKFLSLRIRPMVYFDWPLGKKFRLSSSTQYQSNPNFANLYMSGADSILDGSIYSPENKMYAFEIKHNLKTNNWGHYFNLSHKWKKNNWNTFVAYNSRQEYLEISPNKASQNYQLVEKMLDQSLLVNSTILLNYKNIRVKFGTIGSLIQSKRGIQAYTSTNFDVAALFVWELTKKYSLSTALDPKIYYPSLSHITNGNFVYDQTLESTGLLPFGIPIRKKSFSINFFRNPRISLDGHLFNISFSYSPPYNDLMRTTSISSSYQTTHYVFVQKKNDLSLFGILYKKILKCSLSFDFNINRFQIQNNNQRWSQISSLTSINLQLPNFHNILFSIGGRIHTTAQNQTFGRYNAINFQPKAELFWQHQKFSIISTFMPIINKSGQSSSYYPILNFSINNKSLIKKTELGIKLIDLFHLSSTSIIDPRIGPDMITTEQFNRFTGSLLVTAKYYF